jgi:hypothetical protein
MYPDQESAELAEALRVQAMSASERSAWLENVWGKVQRSANAFSVNRPAHVPTARSYATFEEKNRFDEARELAFAMHHSIYATQKAAQKT